MFDVLIDLNVKLIWRQELYRKERIQSICLQHTWQSDVIMCVFVYFSMFRCLYCFAVSFALSTFLSSYTRRGEGGPSSPRIVCFSCFHSFNRRSKHFINRSQLNSFIEFHTKMSRHDNNCAIQKKIDCGQGTAATTIATMASFAKYSSNGLSAFEFDRNNAMQAYNNKLDLDAPL